MCYWSFTSLVHFWPPPIFNPGYAYADDDRQPFNCSVWPSQFLFAAQLECHGCPVTANTVTLTQSHSLF